MSRVGIKCKLYRNTATYAAPTWDEITCVSDLKVDRKWNEGAFVTRESRVELTMKTFLQLSLTGKVKVENTAASDYVVLDDALNADTVLDIMVLNGPQTENDVRGYRFDAQVFDGSQDQGTGAVLMDDVVIKPTPSANKPKKVVVATGAPVFSDIAA
jgi:hypothetical protein